MSIQITDRAFTRILEAAGAEGIDFQKTFLRVAVVSGGCSGLTYELGWDTTFQDTDEVEEKDGIRIAMDLRSAAYIEGTELDFSEGLEGKGFHFNNPQAARTCACGESFGL
jgi:iron-sulfur cluster assembly protein